MTKINKNTHDMLYKFAKAAESIGETLTGMSVTILGAADTLDTMTDKAAAWIEEYAENLRTAADEALDLSAEDSAGTKTGKSFNDILQQMKNDNLSTKWKKTVNDIPLLNEDEINEVIKNIFKNKGDGKV